MSRAAESAGTATARDEANAHLAEQDASRSALGELIRQALRIRQTVLGLALLFPLVVIVVIGPYLAPHPPQAFVDAPFSTPSWDSLLGTDAIGRDVLSRVLAGGRSTLGIALGATVLGVAVGTLCGLTAALAKSWGDGAIMRTLDVILAFPQYVLVLIVVAMVDSSALLTVALIGLVWVPPVAKVMRAAALGVAKQDFVRYSRSLGSSRRKIILDDILVTVTAPLSVEFGLRLTYSIALVAGLSFLGFGPQPPTPDWGVMIAENQGGLRLAPWATLAPVVCIALLAVGSNLVAEGLARASAKGEETT